MYNMETYLFIYNLLNIRGIGRVKANKILYALRNELNNENLDKKHIYNFLKNYIEKEQAKNVIDGDIELKTFDEKVDFLNIYSENYPNELRDKLKTNSPTILSYLGNLELLKKKKIGFCGSRKASNKGLEVAKDITRQVVQKDIVVVSGYASGIDQQTHYWSLNDGGSTIIVLPEGINRFRIKKFVKDVWDWNRILVLSEFSPNHIWTSARAMQRNSTIIALSDVMTLIEAGATGGSIDAGYKTLKMKKPLFAPVYQDMPNEAVGNQLLINKGAASLKKNKETGRANLKRLFDTLENINKDNKLY